MPPKQKSQEVRKNLFPLLKESAFEKAMPQVDTSTTSLQNHTLEELIQIGQRLCKHWGIQTIYNYPHPNGTEEAYGDVWLRLIDIKIRDLNAKKRKQSPAFHEDIRKNLTITLEYLQDKAMSETNRISDLRDLVSALTVCDEGIYDRLEALAVSKRKATTLAEILAAFRLKILQHITGQACQYYSNSLNNVSELGYDTHMQIRLKQYAEEINLNMPISSDASALNDEGFQQTMSESFFTHDKTNPKQYFYDKFTTYYTPLAIIDHLVEQVSQAAEDAELKEFVAGTDYTQTTLFQNKCQGLPIIQENSDKWHLFYNINEDYTEYSLKSPAELRISMMQVLGDQLFHTTTISFEEKTYVFTAGCPELCYWIDEDGKAHSLFDDYEKRTELLTSKITSFEMLQKRQLTGLPIVTPDVFQKLLEQDVTDFSGCHLQDIDFTEELFKDLDIEFLHLNNAHFNNIKLTAKQWDTHEALGRSNFSGATCPERIALSTAIKANDSECILDLLANGADVNYFDNHNSMLWLAIDNNWPKVVDAILTNPNLNEASLRQCVLRTLNRPTIDDLYKTALSSMLVHKTLKDVNDWQYPDTENKALHLAVIHNHADAIPLLCEKGADISQKNKQGKSPLDLAIDNKRSDLVYAMLKNSSIRQQNLINAPTRNSLFSFAIKEKNMNLIAYLWKNQLGDINYHDKNSLSMLWLAIDNNLPEVVDAILTNPNLNEASLQQCVLLTLNRPTIDGLYETTLNAILIHKTLKDVNSLELTETQNQALHLAIIHNHANAIPLLCKKGADILQKNKQGKSPLDLAIENNHLDFVKAMLMHSSLTLHLDITEDTDSTTLISILINNGLNTTNYHFMIPIIQKIIQQFVLLNITNTAEQHFITQLTNESFNYLNTAYTSSFKSAGIEATKSFILKITQSTTPEQETLDYIQGKSDYKQFGASGHAENTRSAIFSKALIVTSSNIPNKKILRENFKNMAFEEAKLFKEIQYFRETLKEKPAFAAYDTFAQKLLSIYSTYQSSNKKRRKSMQTIAECIRDGYKQLAESENNETHTNILDDTRTKINAEKTNVDADHKAGFFGGRLRNSKLSKHIQQAIDANSTRLRS